MDIIRELCDTVGLEKISLDAQFFERCGGLTWVTDNYAPGDAALAAVWTISMLFSHADCPVYYIPLSSMLHHHYVY